MSDSFVSLGVDEADLTAILGLLHVTSSLHLHLSLAVDSKSFVLENAQALLLLLLHDLLLPAAHAAGAKDHAAFALGAAVVDADAEGNEEEEAAHDGPRDLRVVVVLVIVSCHVHLQTARSHASAARATSSSCGNLGGVEALEATLEEDAVAAVLALVHGNCSVQSLRGAAEACPAQVDHLVVIVGLVELEIGHDSLDSLLA